MNSETGNPIDLNRPQQSFKRYILFECSHPLACSEMKVKIKTCEPKFNPSRTSVVGYYAT